LKHIKTFEQACTLKKLLEELQHYSDNESDNSVNMATGKIFIVHGHDHEALYELERILNKKFGLETTILNDMPV
jgi:predicted nucleotide-binding protein